MSATRGARGGLLVLGGKIFNLPFDFLGFGLPSPPRSPPLALTQLPLLSLSSSPSSLLTSSSCLLSSPLREGHTGCPRGAHDGGTKAPERTDGAHKTAYEGGPGGAQGNLGGSPEGLARGSKTKRHSPLSESDRGRFPLRF